MQNLNVTLQHHELKAEWVDDRHGRAVLLTQASDGYGDPSSVLIDPWQLRAVCEQFGIIASDRQSTKTIITLTRRLSLLSDRIGYLADYLANNSDARHADLTYEQTYARATADIADEFCAELEELPISCKHEANTVQAPCNVAVPAV
jgi:hypothetical protein